MISDEFDYHDILSLKIGDSLEQIRLGSLIEIIVLWDLKILLTILPNKVKVILSLFSS